MSGKKSTAIPVGTRYGRLVVIGEAEPVIYEGGIKIVRMTKSLCQCDCGNTVTVFNGNLRKGATTSCKCFHKERTSQAKRVHGASVGGPLTREFGIWMGLIQRCTSAKHKSFHDYGGRGITVHPDWVGPSGFQSFIACVGPCPSAEHSIDRFPDVNGNYEPGNVRWATRKEQAQNKRNTVYYTIDGRTECLAEWCRIHHLPTSTVTNRLLQGESIEESLELVACASHRRTVRMGKSDS